MSLGDTTRHLRRTEYLEMPWRNGGGVTFEIARAPRAGDEFDWRLSLALIERGGPFSSFAGYRRAIALVSGSGCVLHGIEAQPVPLREPGDIALFSGGAAVTCDLIAGASCDLNLMVREPGSVVAARHVTLAANGVEPLLADCDNAVFCLEGEAECIEPGSGRKIALGLHDTFIVSAAGARNWQARAGGSGARLLTFAWRNARKT